MTEIYDVAIAGAGPAGALAAGLLARCGVRVALLDKATFPRDKACGEYTSPQTERLLARVGALAWVEQARPRRVAVMRLVAPNGASVVLDYGALGGAVLATPRRRLDAALVAYAVDGGAVLQEQTRVVDVLSEGGQVAGLVVRQGASGPQELRARLVIGADGVHSVVARALGLARPARWPRALGMVAHYDCPGGMDDGEMHVAAHGYCGLAPLAYDLVNVGIVIALPDPPAARLGREERFTAALAGFPSLRDTLASAKRVTPVLGVGPVGVGARRPCGAGYLLVGDAAGFFDPFTGEGVYKALHGAELAVEVVLAALERGDFSARALAPYRAARRRAFFAKDLVCRVVQGFVQVPALMDYVTPRLARRPGHLRIMAGVLGDLADPRLALSPAFLLGLLRP